MTELLPSFLKKIYWTSVSYMSHSPEQKIYVMDVIASLMNTKITPFHLVNQPDQQLRIEERSEIFVHPSCIKCWQQNANNLTIKTRPYAPLPSFRSLEKPSVISFNKWNGISLGTSLLAWSTLWFSS